MLQDKSILVTGATGSFGLRFIKILLEKYSNIKKIVIFSRDEYKQYQIKQKYPAQKYPQLKFILGDVRDLERLKVAFEEIDIVIHAAALKQVDTAEENPLEFIKTNIMGAENIIQAAKYCQVKKVIALSSDKSVKPVSLYGATKLCADKLFIQANYEQNKSNTIFSLVRYGNVIGSRGSVIPLFLDKKNDNILPVTQLDMTRFSVPMGMESDAVLYALAHTQGGEIFIPKAPSYSIQNLIQAIQPTAQVQIIGLRNGERLHEELINEIEMPFTYENDLYYVIANTPKLQNYFEINLEYKKVVNQFCYSSQNNPYQLSVSEIQKQIEDFLK
ncbi:MAG: SDR family NAD(P)-dependent oxidoreductase [Bacteroidetes bacterium]|nr:MAG: SDR family NAD(P)-dependent oxidoreductase [Bacteroidota bacterium]